MLFRCDFLQDGDLFEKVFDLILQRPHNLSVVPVDICHHGGVKPAKLKRYLTPEKRPYFSSRLLSMREDLPVV
ncbi:MAG: hypothetical protein WCT05_13210 [Lentisphaeria bacterium]